MGSPLDRDLVVAVASSALFDLSEPDQVYREQGIEAYREYQREHEDERLPAGVAFPFIRRLLALNTLIPGEPPVEVIFLSRNDPDTGSRAVKSAAAHGLDITRGAFLSGSSPFPYIPAFKARLFLSGHAQDVKEAIAHGHPAGRVLKSTYSDDEADKTLCVAFDFDGVLVDDEADRFYNAEGLKRYHEHEAMSAGQPLNPGPLKNLLDALVAIQQREIALQKENKNYEPHMRMSIVTSRSAPAHERLVTTVRRWGIRIDETFFLGGIDKSPVLGVLRPHIFFDDQLANALPASGYVPSVHVPYGEINQRPEDASAPETPGRPGQ